MNLVARLFCGRYNYRPPVSCMSLVRESTCYLLFDRAAPGWKLYSEDGPPNRLMLAALGWLSSAVPVL